MGLSGEGWHVGGRRVRRIKRKMRRGMRYDSEQPLPKSVAGWGHGWDHLVLNQGLSPSQGSSGTVMSAPGHREEKRQTKRGTRGRWSWRGETTGGLTKKTCRDDPQMAAENCRLSMEMY